jgi:phosphoribosylpyrophosphate synthetase
MTPDSDFALIAGDAHPQLAEEIARQIGTALAPTSISAFADGATLAVIAKGHPATEAAVALRVLGDARNRVCLLMVEMSSTGHALVAAAELLARAGAGEIHALFVHAVMSPGALERLCAAPIGRIITTGSVPNATDARVQGVPIAPLLFRAIRRLARRR